MIMKRIACLMLFAALLTSTACGGEADTAETTASGGDVTTQADETVDERYQIKEELPEKNYNDYSVRILMRDSTSPDWIGDMFSESETGEIISDAIYNRNATVGERFGVTFELIRSSNNNYETDGVNSILAGDDAYDIIVPHARAAFVYAEQGLCLDWNTPSCLMSTSTSRGGIRTRARASRSTASSIPWSATSAIRRLRRPDA